MVTVSQRVFVAGGLRERRRVRLGGVALEKAGVEGGKGGHRKGVTGRVPIPG